MSARGLAPSPTLAARPSPAHARALLLWLAALVATAALLATAPACGSDPSDGTDAGAGDDDDDDSGPDAAGDDDDDDADAAPACMADACGPLGCCEGGCCVAEPSNVASVGELAPTGLIISPPDGTFDTSTDCTTPSLLGACEPVTQPGAADVCVCRMDELSIGDVRITGDRALALLAWRRVTITGDLRVGAAGVEDGPGVLRAYPLAAADLAGGAGGSHASAGGEGGADPHGTAALEPLHGGMRGQDGCNGRLGGGGGGALQITAGERIDVIGAINGGGGGGQGGSSSGTCLGGAGGGSGGAVLLEAPTVATIGAIAANGGGGGGGGSSYSGTGWSGTDGLPAADPAIGGDGNDGDGCALYGYTSGGHGGWGSSGDSTGGDGSPYDWISGCLGGTVYVGSGAGGGGAGRIRVNTTTGCQCGGTFSPLPSIGTLATR